MEHLLPSEDTARDRLCVALDLAGRADISRCISELADLVGYFKVNSAFALYGRSLIEEISEAGAKVFLDLKLHDIPHAVSGYADAVTRLGVDLVTVHIAGGTHMLKELVRTADDTAKELGVKRPLFIGVTVLTSVDKSILNSEMNIRGDVRQEVARRAFLAAKSGLDGIVCSAEDLHFVKGDLPEDFFYVTPGIRGLNEESQDHKRVLSYGESVQAGASLLVVGRAIVSAPARRDAASKILSEMTVEV